MEQAPFATILRAEDKDITGAFYEQLGLQFRVHKHGTGPEHYACEFHGAVLEIYKGRTREESELQTDYRTAGEVTLYVALPEHISFSRACAAGTIIQVIREQALAVLRDPDGRAVMIAKD